MRVQQLATVENRLSRYFSYLLNERFLIKFLIGFSAVYIILLFFFLYGPTQDVAVEEWISDSGKSHTCMYGWGSPLRYYFVLLNCSLGLIIIAILYVMNRMELKEDFSLGMEFKIFIVLLPIHAAIKIYFDYSPRKLGGNAPEHDGKEQQFDTRLVYVMFW